MKSNTIEKSPFSTLLKFNSIKIGFCETLCQPNERAVKLFLVPRLLTFELNGSLFPTFHPFKSVFIFSTFHSSYLLHQFGMVNV